MIPSIIEDLLPPVICNLVNQYYGGRLMLDLLNARSDSMNNVLCGTEIKEDWLELAILPALGTFQIQCFHFSPPSGAFFLFVMQDTMIRVIVSVICTYASLCVSSWHQLDLFCLKTFVCFVQDVSMMSRSKISHTK